MWNFLYSIIISMFFLLLNYYLSLTFEIKEEFFFLIYVIVVPILYIIKDLPLLFYNKNKTLKKRLISYSISYIGTSIVFTMFYIKISGIDGGYFSLHLLKESLYLFFISSLVFFVPIELKYFLNFRNLNIKNS